jgi:hypothetical protein
MSKPRHPQELVDRYLQAVRFWLPKGHRQPGDLIAELGEDLRSQIEEKEAEAGHPLDEREVSAILKRCGSPMLVAGRLGPKQHLIGPTLFPIYWFVLKMVLLWILLPVFLLILAPVNMVRSGGDWATALANTLGNLWTGLFIAAGTVTLVFAVVERTGVHSALADKWDPLKLPPLQKPERRTSPARTACELVFTCFGLMWLLLLPRYPALILGPAAAFLNVAPPWHIFYAPILALAVIALVRSGTILARPQWTAFPLWTQFLQTVLGLSLVSFVIHTAAQGPYGAWRPFVAVADASSDRASCLRVAGILNLSIVLTLASVCLGLSIAAIVQAWQLWRYYRGRKSPAQPVSLPAQ